jgi:hypothetical protein
VAIYSTFLQRAYDNVIHDIAVQHLPVIFCMDRAGLVGEDGQTHMGLYDIAYMLAVPGMTVTAPKDGEELIGLLRTALAHDSGPFCTRYPRDKAPAEPRPAAQIPPVPYGTWEQLRRGKDIAILAVGTMVYPAVEAAELLAADGIDCAVINARFLKPLDQAMLELLLQEHRTLVTLEEGTIVNGFGAYLAETLQTTHPEVRVVALGIPDRRPEPDLARAPPGGVPLDLLAGELDERLGRVDPLALRRAAEGADHPAPELDERELHGLLALVVREPVAARADIDHASHPIEVGRHQVAPPAQRALGIAGVPAGDEPPQ